MNIMCLIGIHHYHPIKQEYLRPDLKDRHLKICTRCHKTKETT